MNYCPVCGTKAVGTFCGSCGHQLVESAPATDVPPPTESPEPPASTIPMAKLWTPPPTEQSMVDRPTGERRQQLVLETWFVMIVFLVPGVVSAVLSFSQSFGGVSEHRFPAIVRNEVANLVLGMLAYLPVLSVVPIALFLLWRTGQGRTELGLGVPSLTRDVVPGLGLGAAAFGVEILMLIPLAPFITEHSKLFNSVSAGNFPKYYLIEGIFMSAVTAVTEEVLVNGYLNTRLYQLGWSPRASLLLSMTLRTSYHVYYGIGFIFTIPLGYFVTRSFQKHHKLNRPIMAHFLYDAILFSIQILK
jgi:uncharacterized protein